MESLNELIGMILKRMI